MRVLLLLIILIQNIYILSLAGNNILYILYPLHIALLILFFRTFEKARAF
jgi:hypothetical protein